MLSIYGMLTNESIGGLATNRDHVFVNGTLFSDADLDPGAGTTIAPFVGSTTDMFVASYGVRDGSFLLGGSINGTGAVYGKDIALAGDAFIVVGDGYSDTGSEIDVDATDGTEALAVPGATGSDIIVAALHPYGSLSARSFDESDAPFSLIVPTVTVTSPAAGDVFAAGETVPVRWEATPPLNAAHVLIDRGAGWDLLTEGSKNEPDIGAFDWESDETPCSAAKRLTTLNILSCGRTTPAIPIYPLTTSKC
jgi:hypothetical protein